MINMREYLETRFHEYFRDATFITINPSDENDEWTRVEVTVPHPNLTDGFTYFFSCDPESDDDCFVFDETDGQFRTITIPFPEEA